MARSQITDEQVEAEIAQLRNSPYVKLAEQERRIRNRRRMYLYGLRQMEKKGKALSDAGITAETLRALYDSEEIQCEECGCEL